MASDIEGRERCARPSSGKGSALRNDAPLLCCAGLHRLREYGVTEVLSLPSSSPLPASAHAKSTFSRLAAFYAATYAALGIYMQFFPVWLHDVGGLSHREVTQVQSGQIFARTIAGPLLSQRVDRDGKPTRMVVLLSLLSVLAFACFDLGRGLWPLFFCCLLYGSIYPPLHSVLDNLAIESAREGGFRYTRLRVFGSLSFLVVIVVGGSLLEQWPSSAVYGVMLLLLLASWLFSLRLPVVVREPNVQRRAPVARMLSDKTFVLFFLANGLMQGSHGGYYSLSTLHWRTHGIEEGTAGLLWAEGVVAEILLFFFVREHAERLRPTTLLWIGMSGAIVRWLLLSVLVSPWAIASVNWLHAISFGVTYLGALQFLRLRVPQELQATAQGLLGAFSSGIGMAAGTMLAGFVYEFSPAGAFVAMAGLAAVGGCFAFFVRRPVGVFLRDETQRRANANSDQRPTNEQPPTAS